jgi:hypothetical protein
MTQGGIADMGNYDEARAIEFTAAATNSITGVALDVQEGHPLISQGERRPILLCECVTDPCDCHGPIVWIEDADVHERLATDRRNAAGEQLSEFKIDLDATVLVESVVRAKAGALSLRHKRLYLNPSSHLPAKAGCGSGVGPGTRMAPGSYSAGQECGGGTLYDVYVEADGLNTTFYYVAVGSC